MDYINIIEENFTKSDYVAYLRGSILMLLLEDKPFDTTEFKLYADKLVEVMEEQQADKVDVYKPVIKPTVEPTVDPDEPKVVKEHEFKLGDRVIISKGEFDERTGTIIRLPMDGFDCPKRFVIELDDKSLGWTAIRDIDGVDCENA